MFLLSSISIDVIFLQRSNSALLSSSSSSWDEYLSVLSCALLSSLTLSVLLRYESRLISLFLVYFYVVHAVVVVALDAIGLLIKSLVSGYVSSEPDAEPISCLEFCFDNDADCPYLFSAKFIND